MASVQAPRGSREVCRVVLFADEAIGFAPRLVAAALGAAAALPRSRVVAVVDAAPRARNRAAAVARRAAIVAAERLFPPPGRRHRRPFSVPGRLDRLARRHGVPLVVPAARRLDDPRLPARLAGELGATAALSLGCLQLFRRPLLDAFAAAVNYHDGLLPAYRGLSATAWSVYRGEAASGFTFHHLDERLDGGDVLLQEALPVDPAAPVADLLAAKTRRAGERIGEVLAAIAEGRPGRPQGPGGGYHGRRELAAVVRVGDPSAIEWDDLRRRLHAFERLFLDLAGRRWEVTAVRRVAGRGGPLAFTSRDGVRGEPVRFLHLPRALYRLLRPAAAVPAP